MPAEIELEEAERYRQLIEERRFKHFFTYRNAFDDVTSRSKHYTILEDVPPDTRIAGLMNSPWGWDLSLRLVSSQFEPLKEGEFYVSSNHSDFQFTYQVEPVETPQRFIELLLEAKRLIDQFQPLLQDGYLLTPPVMIGTDVMKKLGGPPDEMAVERLRLKLERVRADAANIISQVREAQDTLLEFAKQVDKASYGEAAPLG